MSDPGLSGTFVNPETGDIWNEGDIYTFPRLGKTLRKITIGGAAEFYTGETAKNMVADIQAAEPRLHSHLVPSSGIRSNSLLHLGGDGLIPTNTNGQTQCQGMAQVHRSDQVWLCQKNRDG